MIDFLGYIAIAHMQGVGRGGGGGKGATKQVAQCYPVLCEGTACLHSLHNKMQQLMFELVTLWWALFRTLAILS